MSLNGVLIPIKVRSVGAAINRYGPVYTYAGDITAFADWTNVNLKFEVANPSYDFVENGVAADLDAIVFSPQAAPEPSVIVLLGTGAIALMGYAWRRWHSRIVAAAAGKPAG